SSELKIAEHWYGKTALEDLLGVSADKVNDDRLYRALDEVLLSTRYVPAPAMNDAVTAAAAATASFMAGAGTTQWRRPPPSAPPSTRALPRTSPHAPNG
ncbi:MAG TPA: hypothetical protein PLX71_07410, partial [Phycicoccus sp.]|nr:hypothetical protein [Phycicoccus sp.]